MFGVSVSELYLLIKLLINIERTVDLCVITKKNTHAYTGTVSQGWIQYTSMLHTGWSSIGFRSWRWHGQMTAL